MAIMKCVCDNEFQDKQYGFKNRVCNPSGKKDLMGVFRCTVCGKLVKKAGLDVKKKG